MNKNRQGKICHRWTGLKNPDSLFDVMRLLKNRDVSALFIFMELWQVCIVEKNDEWVLQRCRYWCLYWPWDTPGLFPGFHPWQLWGSWHCHRTAIKNKDKKIIVSYHILSGEFLFSMAAVKKREPEELFLWALLL